MGMVSRNVVWAMVVGGLVVSGGVVYVNQDVSARGDAFCVVSEDTVSSNAREGSVAGQLVQLDSPEVSACLDGELKVCGEFVDDRYGDPDAFRSRVCR
jgi:hypothetical protein